jgi:hypothetical protein
VALAALAILIAGVYVARKAGNTNTRPATLRTPATESAPSTISAPDSPADASSAEADCPAEVISLPNGARIQPDIGLTGEGTLTVDNGTTDDATVKLVGTNTEDTFRYAYIRGGNKLTLTRIEPGIYHLMFSLGTNWTGDDFTCSPSYSQFEKELVYSESVVGNKHGFDKISVTLHQVPEGNAKTRTISRSEFRHRLHAPSH